MHLGRYIKPSLIVFTLYITLVDASFNENLKRIRDEGEDVVVLEDEKRMKIEDPKPIIIPKTDPRLKEYYEIVKKPIPSYRVENDNRPHAIPRLALYNSKLPPANLILKRLKQLMQYHELFKAKPVKYRVGKYQMKCNHAKKYSNIIVVGCILKYKKSSWRNFQIGDSQSTSQLLENPGFKSSVKGFSNPNNPTMFMFTIVFSMVRRKGLGGMTEEILGHLWDYYGMSDLIPKYNINDLLEIYKSKKEVKKIPENYHHVKIKNLRYLYYRSFLPSSMRDRDFMKKFHEKAKEWAKCASTEFDPKMSIDEDARDAIADEVFTLVVNDAISDFKLSGAFEDLDTNYLLLYVDYKLQASFHRMEDIFNSYEVNYEDGDRDIFDISLLPKIFRWSKMPSPGDDPSDKATAAYELSTYASMLRHFFWHAVFRRKDMPQVIMPDQTDGQKYVAMQTIDPKTFQVLADMLFVAFVPGRIYVKETGEKNEYLRRIASADEPVRRN